MENKKNQCDKFINYLMNYLKRFYKKHDYESCLTVSQIIANFLYDYNQTYIDEDLEKILYDISKEIKSKYELDNYQGDSNTVLFYDGFGMDVRGVAKMYLNALKKNNYKIIYVLPKDSFGKMKETESVLENANVVYEYVETNKGFLNTCNNIITVIKKNKPKAMLFYTTPCDVSGYISFAVMENLVKRYLIDLTDHAFWIGKNCNDYFCGSREMSASNQFYERNISKDKCIKLGVNLVINEEKSNKPLPFDIEKERYIFSGGQLYKTLGDENNYFYKIVNHILENHKDIKFLYAGSGDQSQMDIILKKYPGQAFLIEERNDFYYLIENCVLYLNTYPMFGGMMMKYAANAGKIPITLRHNSDSDGLLINQKDTKIEYDNYENLIQDVDELLNNEEYLKQRQKLLEGSVITEERFINNLRSVIENQTTDYQHNFERIDTTEFRKEFMTRFNLKKEKMNIISLKNLKVLLKMPGMYSIMVSKIFNKLLFK